MSSTYITPPITHSLIHWLALSGVAIDVGNQPANYQATIASPSVAQQESGNTSHNQNISRSAAPSSGTTIAPKQAPQINITIEKFTSFDDLNNFYKSWKTLGIAKTASQAVLPAGCLQKPRIMVISDIPDDHEDRYGQAFSGPANNTIRMALKAAGFAEDEILFSYLSKWRTPAKRPLTAPESDICMQLLAQEIALADPQVILTLGESTIRAISPDSQRGPIKNLLILSHSNKLINKEFTVFASPKSEFLLKTPVMKKSFWFSLLDWANWKGD